MELQKRNRLWSGEDLIRSKELVGAPDTIVCAAVPLIFVVVRMVRIINPVGEFAQHEESRHRTARIGTNLGSAAEGARRFV
jgi:hypothetical protein